MSEVVVISGLAQGMGREVAKLLAKSGDRVAGYDIDAAGIESLSKELSEIGGDHLLTVLDAADRPGIFNFRDRVLEKYDRVNTVVANVGVGFFGPFEEVDLDAASKLFELNVLGCAALLQGFIPHLRENGGGKLIAMSSLVGQIPFPFESIYSATKFALEGLIMSFRYEVEPFGIRCAVIQPAQVSTNFAAKIHKLPPEGSPYRERARRFIEKDEELVKTAPTPTQASQRIYKVIKSAKPKRFNQVDFMSSFFLILNRFLPASIRDYILLNHMDIKV